MSLLAMWVAVATAQTFGSVEMVTVPDASGVWVRSAGTGDAVRIRDGAEVPLSDGLPLDIGDTVRTTQARVQIGLEDGEQINVSEGSELVLRERGVLQQLGSVYYQLRDAFKVEYGYVEATVEGTRFLIEPDTHRIGVSEGAVRVRSDEAEALVGKRQKLAVATQGAVPDPDEWARREMADELQRTWPLDHPNFVIAALFGLGAGRGPEYDFDGNGTVRPFEILRVSARTSPIPHVWVTGSAGFRATGVRFRTFPFSVGAETQLGPLAVGGEAVLALHDRLWPGLNATGRLSIPLDRTVYLEAQGRLGWVADPYAEVSGGVGFGF